MKPAIVIWRIEEIIRESLTGISLATEVVPMTWQQVLKEREIGPVGHL
jgi:hypothetical protein